MEDIVVLPTDPEFQEMKQMTSELFNKPSDLFDPFASSCLLFHTPGLLVPPSFDETIERFMPLKPPRKSHLVFPPRKSTLKIPETLLLHDTPPPLPPSWLRRRQRRKKTNYGNNFRTQAEELASYMRRSVNKIELNERMKWDEDVDVWGDEAERRVQVHEARDSANADIVAAAWLADRMFESPPG